MKQRYSLEEVHKYAEELRKAETEFEKAKYDDVRKQLASQIHVMREVLQRMHESIEKHGVWRPGILRSWLAAREIRKAGTTLINDSINAWPNTPVAKNLKIDKQGQLHPRKAVK